MPAKTAESYQHGKSVVPANFEFNPEVYSIQEYSSGDAEIYWRDISDEREAFCRLFRIQRPLVLKGPTGTGKNTLTRKMHQQLGAEVTQKKFTPQYHFNANTGLYEPALEKKETTLPFPLYIVNGTEDTEIIHLLGGYNATGKYIGGPMYHWAHTGGILFVDEIAEIRSDVQTVFHAPLDRDTRLVAFLDLGTYVHLPDHAMLVAAYNPGYQSKRKPLKISTKQRLPAITFSYLSPEIEAEIIYNASKIGERPINMETAKKLATLVQRIRGEEAEKSILSSREGVSTRLPIMAAELIADGYSTTAACRIAIVDPLTVSKKEIEALETMVKLCGL